MYVISSSSLITYIYCGNLYSSSKEIRDGDNDKLLPTTSAEYCDRVAEYY